MEHNIRYFYGFAKRMYTLAWRFSGAFIFQITRIIKKKKVTLWSLFYFLFFLTIQTNVAVYASATPCRNKLAPWSQVRKKVRVKDSESQKFGNHFTFKMRTMKNAKLNNQSPTMSTIANTR